MRFQKYINEEERWVYGTKDKKWHLVKQDDRDFKSGINKKEFKKIGKEAARKKYLTEQERSDCNLGRSEMFERKLVRTNNWNKFLRTVKKFETNEQAYTTKTGIPIPSKALVCYFNINPSNCLKAYNDFSKTMNDYLFELGNLAISGGDTENIMYRLNKQPTLLMNAYQKATGTKHWLDLDMDINKNFLPYIRKIVSQIKDRKGRGYIIDTKSGFHLLISKDTKFSRDFNPKTIVEDALKVASSSKYETKEIIQNSNQMIPLPGCFQGNYPVTVLNKMD